MPSSRPTCFTSIAWPFYVKLELRATTNNQRMRESAVMISSTIPSAKYSCSGSPLMFWNGSTAIDGLSGKASGGSDAVPTTGLEGPGCVLYLLLTHILECEVELVAHLIAHDPADADPARLGQSFEPRCDIDSVSVDIAPVFDDVAEIDPHTEFKAAIWRHIGISLCHFALYFNRATHRIDDTGKFEEQAVAGSFDDATVMLLDLGIGQFAPDRLEACKGAFFVLTHQPRVACYIGGEDGGETAALAHVVSPAAKRRPERNSSRCSGLRK